VRLLRRKLRSFDIQVQDMTLHIQAGADLNEESRAAALSFWEQLHAYTLRNPDVRTSKRPIETPTDAPEIVREMAAASRRAGVGPVFAFRGAVIDHVGRFVAREVNEVIVSCGGDYFVLSRRRHKLTLHPGGGPAVAIVVPPSRRGVGVSMVSGPATANGLAVLAETCMLAAAAAAGVRAILPREGGFEGALAYLRKVRGVAGGVVLLGERIGMAGGVEIAA
jgi:hypothetical protein